MLFLGYKMLARDAINWGKKHLTKSSLKKLNIMQC
jgi:hypothetical protein